MIDQLCRRGQVEYGFASVCINPTWVKRSAERLRGVRRQNLRGDRVPARREHPEIKAMEARRALRDGAREIDMVINIGALKVAATTTSCARTSRRSRRLPGGRCHQQGDHRGGSKLSDEEKVVACRLAQGGPRPTIVKTSTGFGPAAAPRCSTSR